MAVGSVATVWDGEIAGMRLELESVPVSPVLVLSDSQAAIASVQNAAACGSARSADLRAVVDMVGEWGSAGLRRGPYLVCMCKGACGGGRERACG